MARLYQTGFEWKSVTSGIEIPVISGTAILETTIKHSGAASFEVSGTIGAGAGIYGISTTFTAATVLYAKAEIYLQAMPDDANVVAYLDGYSGTTNVTSIQFYNTGGVYTGILYWNSFGDGRTTFTTNVSSGSWMQVEMYYDTTPADGAEKITVRVNNTDVVTVTNATFTTKSINNMGWGVYNNGAGSVSTEVVYFDDIIIQNGTSPNNSWVGAEQIAIVVPVGAGDNAATSGLYSAVDEIPPTTSDYIELDTNTTIADYVVTSPTTAGITGTVCAISVLGRIKEEAAGTSNYTLRIKSASGGSVSSSSSVDAGNATVRTNPSGTTAFANPLISNTDPATSSAWTITGTNSLTNMQIGVATTDGDPDIWCHALAAMVGYIPSSGTNMKINIGDSWKSVSAISVNIGDVWKTATHAWINISDSWKSIF